MKAGDKLKITRKAVSFHFDNLWKRQVVKYHFPIFAIVLDRQNQSVVTKVTAKYIYQNEGQSYRLSLTVIGFAVEVWWHRHNPKQIKVKL
jgi:hypothetical protein